MRGTPARFWRWQEEQEEKSRNDASSESLTATDADLGMGASWPGGGPHRGASVFCIVVKLRMRAKNVTIPQRELIHHPRLRPGRPRHHTSGNQPRGALADKLKCLLQRHMSKRSG